MTITAPKTKDKYEFNPIEISFCGFSNSGKTTLIKKLIQKMSPQYDIGYAKHDAHHFQMDHSGKDTYEAWGNGAKAVLIRDSEHCAQIHQGEMDFVQKRISFLNYDFVFIEGQKDSKSDKIIFLDDEYKILSEIPHPSSICAFVGKEPQNHHLPFDVPYFCREDSNKLSQWIEKRFLNKTKEQNLFGLVLAGGKSQRMQKDKALLKYSSKTQLEMGYDLLTPFCQKVFISSRANQWQKEDLQIPNPIHDRFLDFGPTGGILSAMQAHPQSAFLVIGCDLPFLNQMTINQLIQNRNPFKMATAFRSAKYDFPEPLCTIYEPKAYSRLMNFLALGLQCPRKVLLNSNIQILDLDHKQALENVNFPEEYKNAKTQIQNKEVRP